MDVLTEDMLYIQQHFSQNDRFHNKTVLITGCAGFLGYYFSAYFISLHKIGILPTQLILCDNFILGKPPWLDAMCVYDFVSVHTMDVTSDHLNTVEGACEADYILHLASIASPIFYRQYPIETIDANVLGLKHILEFYKNKKPSGILYFSSSEIYGDPTPDQIPTDESYRGFVSCTGPRACYDESKRLCETICATYWEKYHLPIGVARPFNNYGPGMKLNDRRAPADFAQNILSNQNIVLLSDGMATRTFCYIADAITGYLKILTHESYDYFNIGNAAPEITITQLAEKFCTIGQAHFHYTGRIVFQTSDDRHYQTDNPQRRCPSIKKAQRILGFDPRITLDDGIYRYLYWCANIF